MADKPEPVTRTSTGLRNALFDEIDLLRSGESESRRAHALARLAAEVINTVKMEMEVANYLQTRRQSRRTQLAPVDFTIDQTQDDSPEQPLND